MHCSPWWVSSWALFWTSCWKKNLLFQFNWDWFLEIYLALLLKYSLLFLYFPWLSVLVCVHWMKQSVLLVLKDWSHAEDKPCQSAWPKLLVASLTFCLSKPLSLLLAAPNNWGCAKSHQCPKGGTWYIYLFILPEDYYLPVPSASQCRLIGSSTFTYKLGKLRH